MPRWGVCQEIRYPHVVARPKTPLIDRETVVRIALRTIDEDGLEGLSLRRLATEIGVNNKSLYHHFRDKNELIAAAAELALHDVGVPAADGEHWSEWLLRSGQVYRDAILAHPALITVMLARGRFNFGLGWFEEILVNLEAQGLPSAATMALIEITESFAVGNVLCKTAARTGAPQSNEVQGSHPKLAEALSQRTFRYDEQFRIGCRQLIEGVAEAFALETDFAKPPASSGYEAPVGVDVQRVAARQR